MNILFVCTGNLCRSVLAQHRLQAEARRRGLPWDVRSCGTAADPFMPVPEPVRSLLARDGEDLHHQPRILSPEMVKWADLVLAMDAHNLAALRDMFPEAKDKSHLFRSYAGLDDLDVADPYGGSESDYLRADASIRDGLERLVARSAPAPKPARRPRKAAKAKPARTAKRSSAAKKRPAKARR